MKRRILITVLSMLMLIMCVSTPLVTVVDAAGNLYWPVPGHTGKSRGYIDDHPALDIWDSSINGATVIAAIGGTVHRIYLCGTQHYGNMHDCNGFGTGLVIKGDDGRFYQYAHMQANSIPSNVYYGGYVSAGSVLGRVGTTGNSTGPHLHFAISNGTSWYPSNVDPEKESYTYTNVDGSEISVTMNWINGTQTPKDTDFYTYVEAQANISGVYQEAGITVWDPHNNNKIVAQKIETPSSSPMSLLQIWYNITAETGSVLTPGVRYVYQIHVKFNGTYYYSPVYDITTTGSHSHTYGNWKIQTAATCTTGGKESRNCSICGAEDTKTTSALGHTPVTDKAVATTCTTTGLTEGSHCSVCKAVIKAQETVPATGHSYKSQVTAPTCAAKGYTTYTCSVCSDSYKDNYKDATGKHTYSNDQDTSCNVCGHIRTVAIKTTPMYRMYDPNSSEHFYTGSTEERDILVAAGWNYEGVGFNFPVVGDPVHRLYEPKTGEHLYTMDEVEMNVLLAAGWNYEGVAFNSATSSEVPQYRLHNPNASRGAYHFTGSTDELAHLVSLGWEYQGIGWYSCLK